MATPRDYLDQIKAIYSNLELKQRLTVAGVILISFVGFGLLMLYANRVEFVTLYTDLSPKDASSIVSWLKKEGIKYELTQGGTTIKVPKEKVYDIRLALASEGLPKESGVGFEIFDKTSLGATDFVQKINYQRALQGELERTISRYPEVRSVRVHIAEPKEALFVSERREPSASVLLTLKPGESLSQRQLLGIVHLVASSVPRLRKERVTIMDTSGEILVQGDEMRPRAEDLTQAQLDYQRKLETYYKHKIQSMLENALGPQKAIARVSVEVDFSKVDLTEERFDPDLVAVRSEQKSLVREVNEQPGGIPGVKGGLASKLRGNVGQAGQSGTILKQENITNYEITKTQRTVRGPVGRIARISAGVVVDGIYRDENGKLVYKPRSPEEMKKLEAIVKAAVGYNEERGDEVQVVNIPFTAGMGAKPGKMAKAVEVGTKLIRPITNLIIAILFLLFVVRPLLKKYVFAPKEVERLEELAPPEGEALEEGEEELEAPPAIEPVPSAQDELRGLASDYPERAAALIKVWLREPVGTEESKA